MSAHRGVISLGSNLGDRLAHLQSAVDALAPCGLHPLVVSSVYETDPVGGPEQGAFLNAVALIATDLDPLEVLAICQDIEARNNRLREVHWGPRTLDLDIIAMDDLRVDDPTLTLPHPRAADRAFVCLPWAEVDPDARLPEGLVRDLAEVLGDGGVHRRRDLSLTMTPAADGRIR